MTQMVTVIIRHILPTLIFSSSFSLKASSIYLFAWSGSAVKSFQASRTSLPTELSELSGDLSLLPLSLALLFASSDSLYTHFWYPSILGGPHKTRGRYPHYQGCTYLNPLVSWLESILKIKFLFLVLGFEKKN